MKLSVLSEGDEDLRNIQRGHAAGDPGAQQALIQQLLRTGQITRDDIILAALCRHGASTQYLFNSGHKYIPGLIHDAPATRFNVMLSRLDIFNNHQNSQRLLNALIDILQRAIYTSQNRGDDPYIADRLRGQLDRLPMLLPSAPQLGPLSLAFDRAINIIGEETAWAAMRPHLIHPLLQQL